MNLAIYFGAVPPPLFGTVRKYIDGKPADNRVPTAIKDNAQRRQGDVTKARILELVDEWDAVDLNFLEAEDTLGISRKALQAHLAKMVETGVLIRIDPPKPKPGACAIWKRPIVTALMEVTK